MSNYCVVVCDGAQSRFFTLEPVDFPELESGPNLVDCGKLTVPNREKRDQDIYSSKAGRDRAPHSGPAHGLDDHRCQHEDEIERHFAREIVEKTRDIAKAGGINHAVLAAAPRMLGFLRQEMDLLIKNGLTVQTVAKNMVKFSHRKIHDHFANEQMLPPYNKLRGQ